MPPLEPQAECNGLPRRDAKSGGSRPHLHFLDGIRGLAALYVAIFHASSFEGSTSVAPPLRLLVDCFRFGHLAVGVFIVLSGFCLMLPVVTTGNGYLPRGFVDYLRRRAWRILPPYYAAFGASVAILAVGLAFRGAGMVQGEEVRTALTPGSVLSHLLLIHNLSFTWAYSVNAPLWTVATEWQIYFLFPLLLLPVWRRFGNLATVMLGFGLGLAPVLLLPETQSFWWAGPWYVGLFVLGMVAADFSFRPRDGRQRSPVLVPAGLGSLVLLIVLCSLPPFAVPLWALDVSIGLVAACLIAYCTKQAQSPGGFKELMLLRFLQSPPVAGLGAFSYSLYLIHHPIQRGMLRVLQTLKLNPDQTLGIQLFVGMPIIIGLAYLFHRAFELPFIVRNQKQAGRRLK